MSEQAASATKLDVIIVGAGLSGLAAAISTRLSGHNVTVFESAKELQEVGAGLQLTPNCTRILQQWGLSDRLWAAAAEPTELLVHRYSGEILALEREFDKNIRAKYGAPFLDSHRVDLQLALYDRARELGVRFHLGERVSTIDFDTPELVTISRHRARADLIVAADGLWSKSRALFTGTDEAPQPTGDLAYRVVLDLEQVNSPELRQWIEKPTVHFWIGPGAHAVGYSLRGGKMYNIVLLVPDDLPAGVSRQPGSVEEMKALFTGWDPILTQFLDMVDAVEKWKLMHREKARCS
jgi:salicylate hydroxylase